jgi:hypothetical protein
MNREAVLMRAVADVIKQRVGTTKANLVENVRTVDAKMLLPEFTNQIAAPDFGPLTEAIERFAAREIPAPQVTIGAPQVTVEAPNFETHPKYEFNPHMDAPVVNVHVDMTPVADAIRKQTECFEKLMGKLLDRMPTGEMEIIKDKDGKITGVRRK